MKLSWPAVFFFLLFSTPRFLLADTLVIDFDTLSDLEAVTTQFPGVTFTNATVLTAGVSLNEFEFPSFSGSNVVSDSGGPMSLSFVTLALSFSGFFTYLVPLTVEAFDGGNNLVATANSAFSSNLKSSGDVGSSPNELLGVNFVGGISKITVTGDISGGSFTLDNATIVTSTIPEPATLSLVLVGGVLWLRKRTGHPRRESWNSND